MVLVFVWGDWGGLKWRGRRRRLCFAYVCGRTPTHPPTPNQPTNQPPFTLPPIQHTHTHRHEVATDIICLQEYFLEDSYRALFEAELGREYEFIVHPRPSKRDGCAVLVRRGMFSVKAVRCVF